MNKNTVIFSVTVALGGLLFGFDTVVISGADQQLQQLWPFGDLFHGFVIMSSALWGTVVGALLGGVPTNKYGRRQTLLWIGVLYFVSAMGSALVSDALLFAAFRFIGGLGVGVSTVAAPAYISEIAAASQRGRLVALYQFNIVAGILLAFLSNFMLMDIGENAWRWMLGVEAIPAFFYTVMILRVPESPRWLVAVKNNKEKALIAWRRINPLATNELEFNAILEDSKVQTSKEKLFSSKLKRPLLLAFLISFFNQFSGINAILYYAPRIFQSAGLTANDSFLSSVGVGIVNLIFTILGVALIDKLGRKWLMYVGSFGYIISLSVVAFSFFYNVGSFWVPIFIFLFIASHAIGQGSVIWVFISEIFPNHLRAAGQSFGTSVHWVLAAIIPASIPFLFSKIGEGAVFMLFACMMVLQLLFVIFIMPETKGKSLEELSQNLK